MNLNIKTTDEYIACAPKDTVMILKKIRSIIRKECPKCEEKMSYGMPAYKFNKVPLVYFAAYKSHIGFYPTSSPIKHFKKELSKYSFAKGTIRFDIDRSVPYDLIKKIVKFRIKEISEKR